MKPFIAKLPDGSQLSAGADLDASRGLVLQFSLTGGKPNAEPPLIHWGITLGESPKSAWVNPARELPAMKHFQWGSHRPVPGAVQTPFQENVASGRLEAELVFQDVTVRTPASELPHAIEFVLYIPPSTWIKNGKSNFVVPVGGCLEGVYSEEQLQEAALEVAGDRLKEASPDLKKS